MGLQVAGTRLHWSQLSPAHSPASSQAACVAVVSTLRAGKRKAPRGGDSPFLRPGCSSPLRARLPEIRRGRGRRSLDQALRRAFSASLEGFANGENDAEEEEFVQRLEELVSGTGGSPESAPVTLAPEIQQQLEGKRGDDSAVVFSASICADPSPALSPLPLSRKQEPSTEPPWVPVRPEPPEWPAQIVPASVEKKANSVELPLSLRIIKRKKRWEDGWLLEAGESACCSVMRAFSSMVFMIRELQSYTLQMREVIFREDLQGILARVQQEMNSSFVWLFQHIFSCTPTLMVSVMLLLANFTVFSMGHLDASAMAAPSPPTHSVVQTVATDHRDLASIKTSSSGGRTASIGGNDAGGGGRARPVAGASGDGRSDDGTVSYRTILPDGISTAPGAVTTEEGGAATAVEEEEATVWKGILEETSRLQASTRDAALMDEETLRRFVSPVTVELEPDDYTDYLRTEMMYQQALSQDPENVLILANFAQFLYLVLRDHDRAEYYFKKATGWKPADADALSRYASFLWVARKDVAAAEETFLEAIAADPSNSEHAANYAHFLWSTGGEDTCYPIDGSVSDAR